MDKAQTFSIQLLDCLQDRLHLEVQDGQLFGQRDRINEFTIERLRSAMREIFEKNVVLDAIAGVEGYRKIQTAGFGYADDFDAFVKVGLLLGDRVVLWERMLVHSLFASNVINVDDLLKLAVSLCRMRSAVEEGSVVMVPHPSFWLERYHAYSRALDGATDVSNELLGLINARAVVDEGLLVQPYSWQPDPTSVADLRAEIHVRPNDPETTRGQRQDELVWTLQHLIHHRYTEYLSTVSIGEFGKATRGRNFRKALVESLLVPVQDPFGQPLSETARRLKIQELLHDVASGLRASEKEVEEHARTTALKSASGTWKGIKLVQQAVMVAVDPTSLIQLGKLLAGGVGAAVSLSGLMKHMGSKPARPMVYQVFARVRDAAQREEALRERAEAAPYVIDE